jgi:pilus assembly protein CpaE
MLAVLDLADVYIVVLTPHLGTLRSARHFLHVAQMLGYAKDRMCFVLNRATNLAGLSFGDITQILGTPDVIQIPSGGAVVSQALNEGRPLVAYQPRSPVSRALQLVSQEVRQRVAPATP